MFTILGFILIFFAGMSDGSFYLPMKYTRKWEWEHTWAVFSFAFFVVNWILTFIFIPNIFEVYSSVPVGEILILLVFGALWGVGAILFGTALHLLGMALGYPIGLGTVACFGALVPLVTTESENLFTYKGLLVIIGIIIAVIGIIVSSRAYKVKEDAAEEASGERSVPLIMGLLVAIFAGVFSSFINIGFSFGENVIEHARDLGVSDILSGTVVWSIFFSIAFLVNILYCLFLMIKRHTLKDFIGPYIKRNFSLGLVMGTLFICAVYVYSMGATCLGTWGEVPGWVLFMSVDIITGNIWGLFSGEWYGAPKDARKLLKRGMVIILCAIVVVALSQWI
ncbi:MAG: hypothetical protein HOC71_13795 [Candidatus Latescibacteria bacterium]|jgi:L-rhamnose-H+ transport protein|nr:hypothetical protein [Candidatus Latescibacterota bacterium]